jgi:hypothetical protein
MPRRRQRILLRRRVDKRFDIIPYRREEAHDPVARPLCRRAPLVLLWDRVRRRLNEP